MVKLPITREEAISWIKSMPQEQSEINHYLESEALMKALAEKFGEDKDYWGMLGLLHDIDWSQTKTNLQDHCIKAAEILKQKGFDEEFIRTIQSHGYANEIISALKDKVRTKKVEFALVASETLTGLIYAYALMRAKKISDMEVSGLKKKFMDKSFAQKCNRDIIKEIEKTGLSLDEFFQIAIEAIKVNENL